MHANSEEDDSEDFDEDDDPDKTEVPGGGKNLLAAIKMKDPTPPSVTQPELPYSSDHHQSQPNLSNYGNGLNGPFNQEMQNYIQDPVFKFISQIVNTIGLSNSGNDFLPYNGGANLFQTSRTNQMTYTSATLNKVQEPQGEDEEESREEENMGVVETYAEYMPAKLGIGKRHPDPVVETSSLASVAPPDIKYKLAFPSSVINGGKLSALQLEAIIYACQQHEKFFPGGVRAGFLIGDGAGVGKGRTVAGIIYENYLRGRKKALWFSVSNDLLVDSNRDLSDIGSGLSAAALNKFKYEEIGAKGNGFNEGVLFSTYSSLIGESPMRGKYNTRLKMILDWCGEDFDGVIVFDECHRAKNLGTLGGGKSTKTGLKVVELQKKLPKARIVYSSATGATEPKNMAYMVRLGIWGEKTPFPTFADFINAVEKRGVGIMEIVAMSIKLRGCYIARQLSFQGVSFKIEEVALRPSFVEMYDEAVQFWIEMHNKFIEGMTLMNVIRGEKKGLWAQFWSAHQRFFKYLCIASKVEYAVKIAREAVKDGKCVVIGLQSTGEARTLDQLEKDDGELQDFVSSAKGVLQNLVEKQFPGPSVRAARLSAVSEEIGKMIEESYGRKRNEFIIGTTDKKRKRKRKDFGSAGEKRRRRDDDSDIDSISDDDESEDEKFLGSDDEEGRKAAQIVNEESKRRAAEIRQELLDKIEELGERLPSNTLDQLIDELGGTDDVAEMTGRKGRVIQTQGGSVLYETRSEHDVSLEYINLTEKDRFMSGEKYIAIISEAASSGISLQSDRRVYNQRRRVHITLELPWSADRAIQQFGRTHRSNQMSAPEYVFLISDLAGERRFASTVAKRLESLGALTHGDRRSTAESRDLSKFNIDTKYGKTAMGLVLNAVLNNNPYRDGLEVRATDKAKFYTDCQEALIGVGIIVNTNGQVGIDSGLTISRFLNRILGMPVRLQNDLFDFFTDTLEGLIEREKKTGRFDLGILDLGSEILTVLNTKKFTNGSVYVELHTLSVERGLSWEEAEIKSETLVGQYEGFYLSKTAKNGKYTPILAIEEMKSISGKKKEIKDNERIFTIYRPNTGMQVKRESLKELLSKNKKCDDKDVAKNSWIHLYVNTFSQCIHAYWNGNCRNKAIKGDCDIGTRKRTYKIICGGLLNVLNIIEGVIEGAEGRKLQVVRAKLEEGGKSIGILIPNNLVKRLIEALQIAEFSE